MSCRARFAIYGALFGTLFPAVALAFDFLRAVQSGGPAPGLAELHVANPLHFIIDLAPLILAWFASLAGKREDRIRSHAAQLEERVAERTASLAEALSRARAADEAKSEFLANTSHELRTPLNAVLGFAELLTETPLTPEQADYVRTIHGSGEGLLALLSDILDVGKIESRQIDLETVNVELELMVHEAVSLIRPRIGERPVELLVDVSEDFPSVVSGDPTRLRQMLLNLLGNAAKFTEEGQIVLHGQGSGLSGDGGSPVVLEVRDTGIGISPDAVATIFERFHQMDASTARKYGGSGLGLTITKGLAELMGGAIEVESEPGRGSVFRLTLPLQRAQAVGDLADPHAHDLDALPVLVVDDLPEARLVVSRLCKRIGLQVHTASNVDEAMSILGEAGQTIRLVLSDVMMPERDGLDLARSVRALPNGAEFRLVALSSWTVSGAAAACRQAGFEAFLPKPVRYQTLVDTVRAMLSVPPGSVSRESSLFTRQALEARRLRGLRVLVAEDNPVNQRLAVVMLEKIGVESVVAEDGQGAIDAVTRESFDAILMDIQMPHMDGLEATRRLRRAGCRVPIIALTAAAMAGDCEHCKEAGMDDYVTKPVSRASLYEVLRRCVDGRKRENPSPESPVPATTVRSG